MTQFEIECRCGGHNVKKKFYAVLQVLCQNYRNINIFIDHMFFHGKIYFFPLKNHEMLSSVSKMAIFRK